MLGSILKGISKIFGGSKSERDLKDIYPRVEQINSFFESYNSFSHDQLRDKTAELKQRIADHLAEIDAQISELKLTIDANAEMDIEEKDNKFKEIEKLSKERDTELEVVLNDILPEAFALVKETARRFTENTELPVTATQMDRDLAIDKDFVTISGNNAIYKNSWDAAGNQVVWNMVHYDVQLIGGMILHSGKIAEMGTGEGKTLVSTLPAFLNALSGQGVHIVTVNEYLAQRDCMWNAPIFNFHGLSVDCIDFHEPNSEERRKAYLADLTYGTNNEFGFDYLRDNMSRSTEDLVQRKHHFAMVDEVDSVLIDDARTPLIISGPVPKGDQQEFHALKPRIERLVEAQKKYITTALIDAKKLYAELEQPAESKKDDGKKEEEAGKLLMRAHRALPKNKNLIKFLGESGMRQKLTKVENIYLSDQQKRMPEIDEALYFVIDEKSNSVELKEKGIELITGAGDDPTFFIMPDVGASIAELEKSGLPEDTIRARKEELMRDFSIKSERIHSVQQLLKAYTLFERDIEYIIDGGKVKIVDEQTGRVMEGRRYSDGLHQAIEAKENVKVEAATQTYATVTLQNFFRMYHKLAGMTGTAETEAGEFWEIYKLDVVVVPTNRSVVRKDVDDIIYKTKREKYNAVIDEIGKLQNEGRPVLVGTTSVEISELLSRMLSLRKIKHNVLNAKQHDREAQVVGEAGHAGTVTISTNMAGRGTDIKLGTGVKEAGGLAILGTERHESRRVDRQLRGRAGRQGDPGSSKFFVSLEDDLMRLFGSDRIASIMDRMGMKEGEEIQHPMISKSIERAQKKVEQNNFGIRKRLLEFDDVMNNQRNVIYARRRNALFGDKLALDLNNMIYEFAEDLVNTFKPDGDYEGFSLELLRLAAYEPELSEEDFAKGKDEDITQLLFDELVKFYQRKSKGIAEKAAPIIADIHKTHPEYKTVSVPFSDGMHEINLSVDLKKAAETEGREIIQTFERFAVLTMIDEEWKEHLRELDELKQAVYNASLEQKDPLLIYKLESFTLFKAMLVRINKDALSMLFKGVIMGQENVKEARTSQPQRQPKLQTSRSENTSSTGGNPQQYQTNSTGDAPPKPTQIKNVLKVGRNEPCPCGSGKKFKQCHGKEE
jgi:preprotein translocase subunit SecA